ncbi:hypothetical protein F2Q68_00028789 [Brassica cretica]|uniref:Uncharacterized protein n=1 Tax=Brassica cretica TaxID=69181 RepID=A0A8S9G1Z2_BRACR|nr:hypothetical protein F2Q68_00028789 [Brassica cretica]
MGINPSPSLSSVPTASTRLSLVAYSLLCLCYFVGFCENQKARLVSGQKPKPSILFEDLALACKAFSETYTDTLVTLGIVISTFSINQSIRSHDNEKVKEDSNALTVLVLKNKNAIRDVESLLNLAEEKLISVAKELEVEKEKLEKEKLGRRSKSLSVSCSFLSPL